MSATPRSTILRAEDLERIKSYTQPPPTPPAEQLRRKKLALHEKSKAEVATWGNTIDGARRAKLEAKDRREAERERVAVQTDLEDARWQAEERRKHIQRCRMQQFKQTDLVKSFKTAEFLTEVLRERDGQRDTRGNRQAMIDAREARRFAHQMQELDEAQAKEDQKQEQARLNAIVNAAGILEQAAAKREIRRAQRQAELEEQAAQNKDAVDFLKEEEVKYISQRQSGKGFLAEMDAARDTTLEIKRRNEELQELTDQRNSIYIKEKEAMEKAKKEKLLKMKREKQEAADALTQSLYTTKLFDDEAEGKRIARIEQEHYENMDREEERKRQRRLEATAAIEKHREAHARAISAQKREEKADNLAAKMAMAADVKQFFSEEEEIEASRLAEAKKTQTQWMDAIVQHNVAKVDARQALVEERDAVEQQLDWEKEQFRAYAQEAVSKAKFRGCTNVYPLTKAIDKLKGWQPKPKPNLPTLTTRTAGNPFPGDTKRRTGFVWN